MARGSEEATPKGAKTTRSIGAEPIGRPVPDIVGFDSFDSLHDSRMAR